MVTDTAALHTVALDSETRSRQGTITRTRSIWWNQLILAASVVIVTVVMLAFDATLLASTVLVGGLAGILVITAATLAVPWARVPPVAVFVVPLLDIVCIGLMTVASGLMMGFLWAFPVIWIATYAGPAALATGAVVLVAMIALVTSRLSLPQSVPALTIVVVTLGFAGLTAGVASRRNRAFRRLLRLQAVRHRRDSLIMANDERRVVELTNSLEEGIARIGRDGTLLFANDAYVEAYGLDPADLTQPSRSIEYGGDGTTPVPEWRRPQYRAARGESFADERVWLFHPSGVWRSLSLTSKRLSPLNGDSRPSMFVITRDVTELEARSDRDRPAARTADDVRPSLAEIVEQAGAALDVDELGDATRSRLEAIRQAAARVQALLSESPSVVGQIGPGEGGATDIDLRAVLRSSTRSFDAAATAAEIVLEVQLPEALPVRADGTRLRQVVDALLSNAVRYTAPGGRVIVAGRLHRERAIVTITDTGIGMTASELRRVLEPPVGIEPATESAPGTGIGMRAARDILDDQGGVLTVDSRHRAGTTVTVDLPAAGGATVDALDPDRERVGSP